MIERRRGWTPSRRSLKVISEQERLDREQERLDREQERLDREQE